MSAIPTVRVVLTVRDGQGQSVEAATVKAVLTATEYYQGMEVPGQAQGVTNGAGEVALALFPNELGSQGAVWQITVTTPLGTTIRHASVPNMDCTLLLQPGVIEALRGPQGQQGIKGDKGDRGEKGDKGDKGDRGEPGESASNGTLSLLVAERCNAFMF